MNKELKRRVIFFNGDDDKEYYNEIDIIKAGDE
jgi:hypothetical protein